MRNIFKKSFLFILVGLTTSIVSAETMYVISGQCNVPLSAGMNNATNSQFFIWDGSTATLTTAVTCNITATAGFYYNSTSLAYADITNTSNYSSSSSSARTMRGFKITGSETMTIGLGSIAISKIIVGGRCASNDPCTLNVAGETVSTNNKNSFVKVVEGTFTNQIQIANSSGKEYNVIVFLIEGVAGPVAVTGVTLNKITTSIEAGQSEQLTATVLPANADNKSVTWSSNNTAVATVDNNGNVSALAAGTATITVTTADGNKTATCTVTVTAPAAPIDVQSISMKSSTTIAIGASETLTVTYTPADANTGKAVTWTSSNTSVATVDNSGKVTGVAAGSATITATSTTDPTITASCNVTVQAIAVTNVSLNKSTINLQVGGNETLTATVLPDNATNKNLTWSSSAPAIASVDQTGKVTAHAAGSATITVASVEDNTKAATCTVTVTSGPPVPSTTLSLHVPEVYDAKEIAGGYGGTLSVINGREYEVYYAGRYEEKVGSTTKKGLTIHVNPPVDKQHGITTNESDTHYEAKDGWFKGDGKDKGTGFAAQDEFVATTRCHTLDGTCVVELHVEGFDQFSIYATDKKKDSNPANNKYFKVIINDVEQSSTISTSASIRRFDMTTSEKVIKIVSVGGDNLLGGFSLRVANEPRTKYLKGNDSSQVVMQTANIKPIVYTTKYNNIPGAETRLEWIGAEANGITLTKVVGTLSDTLTIGGAANCPTGTYQYAVVAYYNGVETNRATGQFFVRSDIQATSDVDVDAYQNEEMDQITFKYYALSANDVQLTWPNGQPQGVSGSGNNGKYIIGGTPNVTGPFPKIFPFTITVTGADTVIQGQITVKDLDYGSNAVLYLYKNNKAYEKDGVYKYLNGTGTGKYHLIERKAKLDGLRPADQYAHYKWILISEDVDADNPEILALARGEGNLPVLSMKSFSYTPERLNWGEPNNGSLTYEEGRFITVVRDDHPIFKDYLQKKKGDRILVLKEIENKGLMPVAVNYQGTLCLATARTRDIDNYDLDGPEETFLHEVPAEIHRNQKYLCLPISMDASNHLHDDGKKLIDACVKYILSSSASIKLPDLAITEFKIGSYKGIIDDNENRIVIEVPAQDSTEMHAVTPEITLASPLTHVTPKWVNADGTIDFSNWSFGVPHTVSDYINVRTYDVIVRLQYAQGIEAVEANEWINIYDVYGRKVTTTNEDYRTMDLPKGMYIIVTESGQTIKIMR